MGKSCSLSTCQASAKHGRKETAEAEDSWLDHAAPRARAHALSLHRAFGLYGTPEQAIAGQRASKWNHASICRCKLAASSRHGHPVAMEVQMADTAL